MRMGCRYCLWKSPLLAVLAVLTSVAHVDKCAADDHILDPPPPGARYCAAAGSLTDFSCVENPYLHRGLSDEFAKATTTPDEAMFSLGVPQRIEGTETEKSAIRAVVQAMEDYFYREVRQV